MNINLIRSVVALVADTYKRTGAYIGITDHTLTITFLTQSS